MSSQSIARYLSLVQAAAKGRWRQLSCVISSSVSSLRNLRPLTDSFPPICRRLPLVVFITSSPSAREKQAIVAISATGKQYHNSGRTRYHRFKAGTARGIFTLSFNRTISEGSFRTDPTSAQSLGRELFLRTTFLYFTRILFIPR